LVAGVLALTTTSCGDPASSGSPAAGAPVVAFTAQCDGTTCTFSDSSFDSQGTIIGRTWNFGDGSTSDEINPQHTYPAAGTYHVVLSVVNNSGRMGSKAQDIVVQSAAVLFIGAGDIADCSSSGSAETAAIIEQYPAAAVFTLGDNAYENGSPTNYSQCYDPTWGKFKARTHPAPGNHDYNTPGATGYFGYFGASAGPAGLGYYSYDIGSWHIISLNSEIEVDAASAQATWLKQDLADHPAQCTLAYWHKPLFTSGAVHAPDTAMQPLFTMLYDAGADVVLSGHNHQYERFAPQKPDGTLDETSGIRSFVVGTGGGGALYGFTTPEPNSEVRYEGLGVLKLTLGSSSYAWEFVPVARSSFSDSGTGSCH
jgi:acid phosphatase type 7